MSAGGDKKLVQSVKELSPGNIKNTGTGPYEEPSWKVLTEKYEIQS